MQRPKWFQIRCIFGWERDEGLSNKLFKKLFRKFQKAILVQGGCFLSPAQSSLVESAMKAMLERDATRGFGVAGALRKLFRAMPSEVLAFRERSESNGTIPWCGAKFIKL